VIIVEPLVMPPPAFYQRGVAAKLVQTVRAADAAPSAKLGNYLASALALREARAAGADEALVVNRDGYVVEGTTANLFLVRQGELVTPPLDIGILEGITRKVVIGLAEGGRRLDGAPTGLGLRVRLEALRAPEVLACDEAFLTSSVRELVPIVTIDGTPLGGGSPGPVTRKLHRAFREHVGLRHRMPWEEQAAGLPT
jgi:branched-chain amino acid aminotransferase